MIRVAAAALDAILIELEMRGHRVQLSADYHHRPPVDVAQRPITDDYYGRRPNDWRPHRPTVAYVGDVQIGLTLFELTEHVRVRRTGADRYVRIRARSDRQHRSHGRRAKHRHPNPVAF